MIRGMRYPTADHLRHALGERVRRFTKLTGTTQSAVGLDAVGDKSAVSRITAGSNFKIATYESLMIWLDNKWPQRRLTRRRSGQVPPRHDGEAPQL